VRFLGKRTGSIAIILCRILPQLTVLLGLFLIGAEFALSAPAVQIPSIALEGLTRSLDSGRLTSSPPPSLLVLIGALVLLGVTPWGRILQAVRRKNSCKSADRLPLPLPGRLSIVNPDGNR
jgi:hypothetical protein